MVLPRVRNIVRNRCIIYFLSLFVLFLSSCERGENIENNVVEYVKKHQNEIVEIPNSILFNENYNRILIFPEGGKYEKYYNLNIDIDNSGAYKVWVFMKDEEVYAYYKVKFNLEKPYKIRVEYNEEYYCEVKKNDKVFIKKQKVDNKIEYILIIEDENNKI